MDIPETIKNITSSKAFEVWSFKTRALFYLLTPQETFFEKAEDVPAIDKGASEVFFILVFVEQLAYLLRDGKFNGKISDAVASMSGGIILLFPNFFIRKVSYVMYEYVHANYLIYELPWNSAWTYVFMLLFVDMMYYWNHRAAHEVNVFWIAHATHHSSEEYNLTTALRQSMFLKFTNWIFYMPLALFVRPSIFMVHSHMNLLYQFWIHTQIIGSMGPLEHILNTPSHHRVHHGRNPYCIDKNYAAVFIIWDKLFGTFAKEKDDEELAYGLVHPITTFDPIYIQLATYQYIAKRAYDSKSFYELYSVLFKGPGWVPGSGRLGHHEDLPAIKYPVKKFEVKISPILNGYVAINFLFIMILYVGFMKQLEYFPTIVLSVFVMSILYTLTCFGKFFDGKKSAVYYDLVRVLTFVLISLNFEDEVKRTLFGSQQLTEIFKYLNIFSLVFMTMFTITSLTSKGVSKVAKEVKAE